MLLAIDVGNTNMVIGIFKQLALMTSWRISTDQDRTIDEYGILIRNLITSAGLDPGKIDGIAISCVIPSLVATLRVMADRYFHQLPLFVEPGIKTGMPILYENPQEVGADRIVNSVAAFTKYGGPVIVVDFGTATTFDAVSADGEYLGGVIAPGITISSDALFQRAAKLPRVEIKEPEKIIGKNTVESMQAGLYFGYRGLVDGILKEMKAVLGEKTVVVATGGLAGLFQKKSLMINALDKTLTLDGLRLLWERNAGLKVD